MAEQGGSRAADDEPAVPTASVHPAPVEAELVEALALARTELSRIRGNLALVATFLTSARQ